MSGHGVTLALRWIQPPPPQWVHRHPAPVRVEIGGQVYFRKPAGMTSYVNPGKDRSLPGKSRRRARREARRQEQAMAAQHDLARGFDRPRSERAREARELLMPLHSKITHTGRAG